MFSTRQRTASDIADEGLIISIVCISHRGMAKVDSSVTLTTIKPSLSLAEAHGVTEKCIDLNEIEIPTEVFRGDRLDLLS